MVVPRVGARYQARARASPDAQSGTVVFDPARTDERALSAYLADARGARRKFASDGAWEEAALGALHACGYDAPRALARLGGAKGAENESKGKNGTKNKSAVGWRRVHARLNARRDEHDGRVARGATVLLRSESRMPYVARVESVRHSVRGTLLDVRWFYRRADLRGVRAPANELFLSAHTDTNHASTVVGECAVLAAPSATELFCVRAVHFPATHRQTVGPIGERPKARAKALP
jgi:hypothetical protein